MSRIPKIFKNAYFLIALFFFIWMLFLDSNDFISQWKLNSKLRSLEKEKAYYEEKIKEVQKEREELMSDQELIEKFARERYLMKKREEDLFIIEEE